MTLSFQQLRALAASVGFPDPDMAAAVALAESGGDTTIVRDTRGKTLPPGQFPEYSIGLWQINVLSPPGSSYTPDSLTDPTTNAKVAYSIFAGAGGRWTPGWWYTINHGSYRQFLPPGYVPPGTPRVTPPSRGRGGTTAPGLVAGAALALLGAAGYLTYRELAT